MRKTIVILTGFLLVFMIGFLLYNNSTTITGHSSYEGQAQIESLLAYISGDSAFVFLGPGDGICIVIEVNKTEYSYKINNEDYWDVMTKKPEGYRLINDRYITLVRKSACSFPVLDNVIIKFSSVDELVYAAAHPRNFILTRRNSGYYILPSNYVKPGGEVVCSEKFQKTYCAMLYPYFGGNTITRELLMPCCGNYAYTPAGRAFLVGMIVSNGWFWFVAILAAIIVLLILLSRKKEKKFRG